TRGARRRTARPCNAWPARPPCCPTPTSPPPAPAPTSPSPESTSERVRPVLLECRDHQVLAAGRAGTRLRGRGDRRHRPVAQRGDAVRVGPLCRAGTGRRVAGHVAV